MEWILAVTTVKPETTVQDGGSTFGGVKPLDVSGKTLSLLNPNQVFFVPRANQTINTSLIEDFTLKSCEIK